MTWSGGCFDQYGTMWIILKSIWYGAIALLIGLSLIGLVGHTKFPLAAAALAIIFLCLDFVYDKEDAYRRTPLDGLISNVGYLVSRIQPYVPGDSPVPPGRKTVIPPNTRLEATTGLGKISISSGNGFLRTIAWDGVTRAVEIAPFDNGIAEGEWFRFPLTQTRCPGYDWERHKGVSRCQYLEARINCHNVKEALAFIRDKQDPVMPFVFTHEGIVVGWTTQANREELTIEVYQLIVNGRIPNLPGATDDKINQVQQGKM